MLSLIILLIYISIIIYSFQLFVFFVGLIDDDVEFRHFLLLIPFGFLYFLYIKFIELLEESKEEPDWKDHYKEQFRIACQLAYAIFIKSPIDLIKSYLKKEKSK